MNATTLARLAAPEPMLYMYSKGEFPMLALRLPPDIEKRLDDLAKRTGRTKSYYARQAIIEHLEDMEDIALAEERLKSDDGVRIALEDVMRELDAREAEDGGKSTAAE
jgi:RHH-type transcriptional regulator, rel operon repressor / antitoxin RelB